MFCSLVLDSTSCVHEDQVVDEVGVEQETYALIYDQCVRESEEEIVVKDDFLPSTHHQLYPDITCDSATFDFPSKKSQPDVSTFDQWLHWKYHFT